MSGEKRAQTAGDGGVSLHRVALAFDDPETVAALGARAPRRTIALLRLSAGGHEASRSRQVRRPKPRSDSRAQTGSRRRRAGTCRSPHRRHAPREKRRHVFSADGIDRRRARDDPPRLGERIGKKEEGERVASAVTADLAEVARRNVLAAPPRVLLLFGVQPIVAAGPKSFGDEIIARAGGLQRRLAITRFVAATRIP